MDQAQRILIISHRSPDADSIGANLALREALENNGKSVDSACVDPVCLDSTFLKGADRFLNEIVPSNYDLIISVDCGDHKLMGFHIAHPELLDRKRINLINIDHHPSNDDFGTVNIVMTETPATCFILYLMFSAYGWGISSTMASALLSGLYYDTGSFMHSNTSAQSLRIASRLKALGADHGTIIKKQFHTTSLEKLKLYGRALSRVELNEKEAVVTVLTEEDYKTVAGELEDSSGIVNYLSHVSEGKFCVFLTEDMKGNIKGSLRTQSDEIDLSKIAGLFGGGGHKKAAGFTVPGRLKEKTVWTVSQD